MKRIIVALLALALALAAPAFAGGPGSGPFGNKNQHQNGSTPNGNNGKGPKKPKVVVKKIYIKGDTVVETQTEYVQDGRSNSVGNEMMFFVGGLLLGFACERERNREDKTPAMTLFCKPGEMPDPFAAENQAQ